MKYQIKLSMQGKLYKAISIMGILFGIVLVVFNEDIQNLQKIPVSDAKWYLFYTVALTLILGTLSTSYIISCEGYINEKRLVTWRNYILKGKELTIPLNIDTKIFLLNSMGLGKKLQITTKNEKVTLYLNFLEAGNEQEGNLEDILINEFKKRGIEVTL